jgi:hypothetical protein
MILVSCVFTLLFVFPAIAQPPDTLWTQTFGGGSADFGHSVQQTSDGGFIIAGYTEILFPNFDIYLIKTDASGTEQWTQTFGGSSRDYGESVQQTGDGGYIIAGYTDSYGAGNDDVWLIKTDADGDSVWTQIFGGLAVDRAYSVQQTGDGGYIITGSTSSYGAGDYDVYLIKTDASGIEQWSQTFGGNQHDYARSVQQTEDGGYIIAGYTSSYGAGNSDVWLIKTDASGIEQWTQTFGGSSRDYGESVQQTDDGGYIIAGSVESWGLDSSDVYLIKTDASGIEQWSQTFGEIGLMLLDYGHSVQQTGDGGYIIAGSTQSYGAGNFDVWLIKTDASGIEKWSQTFGGSSIDYGHSVQQTDDGGYIIAGYTLSYGAGSFDVWLIRLETDMTVILTLTPLNPPIQIPAGGGSFDFDIEIENISTTTYTVDVLTDVTLPDGMTYPLLLRSGINLASGASITRNLTQFVPGGAPAGNYTYNGHVYDHNTWILLGENSFSFEKLAGDDAPNHNLGWALFGWDSEEAAFVVPPAEYALQPASPNPFNPTTTLSFKLPDAGFVTLAVYDVSGRMVAELIDGWRNAGAHEVAFDASNLASGIYLAKMDAGAFSATQKLVLLK